MYFRKNYAFLSNMYPHEIDVDINGTIYHFSCVESAYQAHKCLARVNEFIPLTGLEAKKLGKSVKLDSHWDEIKVNIMEKLLRIKFSDKLLLKQLCDIDLDIVEHNCWGDTFWGVSYGKGQNILGKLLMKIRDEKMNVIHSKNSSEKTLI